MSKFDHIVTEPDMQMAFQIPAEWTPALEWIDSNGGVNFYRFALPDGSTGIISMHKRDKITASTMTKEAGRTCYTVEINGEDFFHFYRG